MLKTLFEEQRSHINHFFDHIDTSKTEAFIQRILQCKGTLVFTGVGKSSFIAHKLAMTFLSLGIPSSFLSPAHALHGDIGMLTPQDILVCLSKSGETEELLSLLPHVKKKGATLIAIVSNSQSKLAREANLAITLPLIKELCPFNLIPTTSPALQLLFGDMVAIAVMKAKKLALTDFAPNHPAGTIGKKTSLFVKDLMLSWDQLPLCSPRDRLQDLLPLFSSKQCGALIIIDSQKALLGIFTDGDLRRAIAINEGHCLQKPIQELMTPTPRWTAPLTLAWEAMKQMEEDPLHPITLLPVLDEGQVVGALRMHDILQAGLRS